MNFDKFYSWKIISRLNFKSLGYWHAVWKFTFSFISATDLNVSHHTFYYKQFCNLQTNTLQRVFNHSSHYACPSKMMPWLFFLLVLSSFHMTIQNVTAMTMHGRCMRLCMLNGYDLNHFIFLCLLCERIRSETKKKTIF